MASEESRTNCRPRRTHFVPLRLEQVLLATCLALTAACVSPRPAFPAIGVLAATGIGPTASAPSSSLTWHGQWSLTLPTAPQTASSALMLATDWVRPLGSDPLLSDRRDRPQLAISPSWSPDNGVVDRSPVWWGQVHLQATCLLDLSRAIAAKPDSRVDPVFRTDELWLQLTRQARQQVPFWVRWGRQRFQAGPVGLLVANPFDAIAATRVNLHLPRWGLIVDAGDGRLDTSYVTALPYVWDQDAYRWLRLERAGVGLTWLADGLGSETGAAVDAQSRWRGHAWVAEAALFHASRTADNYAGWVGALVGSVDLISKPTFKLNVNAGSVHPGFTPMASNLASAGGNLNFKNGSSGVELNLSWLVHPQWLLENETSVLWRFGWLDAGTLVRFTQAWVGNLRTVAQLSWRPSSPILTPTQGPDGRSQWAGQWQLRWEF